MGRSSGQRPADVHDGTGPESPAREDPEHRDGVLVTVSDQPDAADLRSWDRLVATSAHSDVAQLSAWAAVRRHAGFTPIFLLASSTGRTVGGALVLQRRLPGFGGIGYLPYGPVLPVDGDGDRAATEAALCHALAELTGTHLRALFVQPPMGAEAVSRRLLRLGFRPSSAGVAPTASLGLDLSPPPEQLRRSLSSGTRGSIKRASSRGIRVRTATEPDLPVVAELLAETAAHHNFPPLPLDYLHTLYRQLDPGNHLTIFIAEQDGVAMATQVITGSGGAAKLRLTGMRRTGAAQTGAPALLQWETILWAKANGYHTFDFGGISPPAVDAIRAGRSGLASRVSGRDYFKASFGGTPFRYPQPVELFSSRAAQVGYDLARRSEPGRRIIRRVQHLLRHRGRG
jgi:lipid II:glycine glycyltransferase (peptidoglycan interpeptide bridge formation enzyme)